MADERKILERVVEEAAEFLDGLAERPVHATADVGMQYRVDDRVQLGGQAVLRISVSNWQATSDDVDRSVAAIQRVFEQL